MLKWAVTARGSATSTSGSGLSGSTRGGGGGGATAAAWPTYEDVSAAEPGDVSSWSTSWFIEKDHDSVDDEENRDSLSAYDDNASTLEQMMTIDFNDDSQVGCVVQR